MLVGRICRDQIAVIVLILFAGTVSVFSSGAVAETIPSRPDLRQRIETVVDQHIVPSFIKLKDTTNALSFSVTDYCTKPDPETQWSQIKSTFSSVVLAWAAVSHLDFGPLSIKARSARLAFFPDPRGIVRRQLRRLFASPIVNTISADNISGQSVAIQGLTALEQLLIKPIRKTGEDNTFTKIRCQLAVAIAANVAKISNDIASEWQSANGWRERLLSAGPDDQIYRTTNEAAAELVKALTTALDRINQHQILPLQKAAENKRSPVAIPFHRSGISKAYLVSLIDSASDLYTKLNLAPYVAANKPWLSSWLPKAISALKTNAAPLNYSNETPYTPDSQEFESLRHLERFSRALSSVVTKDLGPAAGLTIGFNQVDGD